MHNHNGLILPDLDNYLISPVRLCHCQVNLPDYTVMGLDILEMTADKTLLPVITMKYDYRHGDIFRHRTCVGLLSPLP